MYADETGWHILGKKSWCWHFNAPTVPAVRYLVADTRGKGVLAEHLNDPDGVVADFYGAYKHVAKEHQVCWAHLLRDTHLLTLAAPDHEERQRLQAALTTIYERIRAFKAKEWSEERARRAERTLSSTLTDLIKQRWRDTGCQRIIKRITMYQRELLTCLHHPAVLPRTTPPSGDYVPSSPSEDHERFAERQRGTNVLHQQERSLKPCVMKEALSWSN